jgi:hypothetical protein
MVIRTIKQARRAGKDLCWTAVVATDSPLRRAAYVAVQKRIFGSWARALEAAGVDADTARRYQDWDPTVVVAELKQIHADREPLKSSAVRKSDPPLHAAAVRYFGSFGKAVRAAGISSSRRTRTRNAKKRLSRKRPQK